MARQSTTPVSFQQTTRKDTAVLMSSARAGVVVPAGFFPMLAGDSASGSVGFDISLKDMPRPLLNGVTVNLQAWCVPKSAFPQFSGRDELNHARTGQVIKSLGAADRSPPPYFNVLSTTNRTTFANSQFAKVLGIHLPAVGDPNADLIDAFNLIYNFRLAAHSSRLPRRKYATELLSEAVSFPPAFWPSSRFSNVVPDYERALIVGSLDLDVLAGRIPVRGLGINGTTSTVANTVVREADGSKTYPSALSLTNPQWVGRVAGASGATAYPDIWAEMAGRSVSVSLADIDKARTTQAFAKMRTAYAGNDSTGFDNDDTLVSLLMQGIPVAPEDFKRPWLLDSKRVGVGFAERFATDGANLDASVSVGRVAASLSLNVPRLDVDAIVVFTIELIPERIDERMSDEWLLVNTVDGLPDALRDIQRVEPVDHVLNRRVDAKHTSPSGLYGFEPMNDKWNRDFTRLGGDFYQATVGAGFSEARSNIWQSEIVNPAYASTHFLAPAPFPHDVFSDQLADAFEFVCRHGVAITGLTQIGDVLAENNDDYVAISEV